MYLLVLIGGGGGFTLKGINFSSLFLLRTKIPVNKQLVFTPGGGGGIRTLEGFNTLLVFKTSPFNHSGTPPCLIRLAKL